MRGSVLSKSKKPDYIEVFGYKIPRWPVCSMGELEALEAYHRTPGATETGAALVAIAAAIRYRLGEDVAPDDLRRKPADANAIRNAIEALTASYPRGDDSAKNAPEGARTGTESAP